MSKKMPGSARAGGPLEVLLDKLRALAVIQKDKGVEAPLAPHGPETLADDGEALPAVAEAIARDEGLVRQVLALVGVDYDALIAMDGKSPYARAVEARPALVSEVLASESPVLAALKAAWAFRPVADFVARYGDSPDAIKAAILAENAGRDAAPAKPVVGTVFSGPYGVRDVPPEATKKGLDGMFGR